MSRRTRAEQNYDYQFDDDYYMQLYLSTQNIKPTPSNTSPDAIELKPVELKLKEKKIVPAVKPPQEKQQQQQQPPPPPPPQQPPPPPPPQQPTTQHQPVPPSQSSKAEVNTQVHPIYSYNNASPQYAVSQAAQMYNLQQVEDITRHPSITYNIYVGGLSKDVDEADLYNYFAVCGAISSTRIFRNKDTGEHMGYGFVHFTTVEGQTKALSPEYQRPVIKNCIGFTKKGVEKSTLFLGNLPLHLKQPELQQIIRDIIGPFNSLVLKTYPPPSCASRGFCFVSFESHMEAEKARKILSRTPLQANVLTVGWADPLPNGECDDDSKSVTTLYVSQIPVHVHDDQLEQLFRPFGELNKCTVVRNQGGESRGFAFVEYKERGPCVAAMTSLNGHDLYGARIEIVFARPQQPQRSKGLAHSVIRKNSVKGHTMNGPYMRMAGRNKKLNDDDADEESGPNNHMNQGWNGYWYPPPPPYYGHYPPYGYPYPAPYYGYGYYPYDYGAYGNYADPNQAANDANMEDNTNNTTTNNTTTPTPTTNNNLNSSGNGTSNSNSNSNDNNSSHDSNHKSDNKNGTENNNNKEITIKEEHMEGIEENGDKNNNNA